MTLADYIRKEGRVAVHIKTSGSTDSAIVTSPRELPFPASMIQGWPTNYNFVWDGIGIPTDSRGRRILGITAFPATENFDLEGRVFP